MRKEIATSFYAFSIIISTIMMANTGIVCSSDYHIDTKVAVFGLALVVWFMAGALVCVGALIERGGKTHTIESMVALEDEQSSNNKPLEATDF